MTFSVEKYKREISAAIAFALLLFAVAIIAPSFFESGNFRDLIVNNAATMLVAIGMTIVIISGQIDISVGSQFAVCSVAAGMLAKTGMPTLPLFAAVLLIGAAMGTLNGRFDRTARTSLDHRDISDACRLARCASVGN